MNYISEFKFIVDGKPKTKSNHNLVNNQGKKIMNKEYAAYERKIVNSINESREEDDKFLGKIICVIRVFFKNKRHPDLNNMPKSICDGIEKSGIIGNDKSIVSVYLEEFYDSKNPRVEVELYDYNLYKPSVLTNRREENETREMILNEKKEQEERKKRNEKKKSSVVSDKNKVSCISCDKTIDKNDAKKLHNKNEYICIRCLLGI